MCCPEGLSLPASLIKGRAPKQKLFVFNGTILIPNNKKTTIKTAVNSSKPNSNE
jgi:hypothetical protein